MKRHAFVKWYEEKYPSGIVIEMSFPRFITIENSNVTFWEVRTTFSREQRDAIMKLMQAGAVFYVWTKNGVTDFLCI